MKADVLFRKMQNMMRKHFRKHLPDNLLQQRNASQKKTLQMRPDMQALWIMSQKKVRMSV